MAFSATEAVRDRTSFKGMTDRALRYMEAAQQAAEAAGLASVKFVAGRGPGHKSHKAGTEFDMVGYNADGRLWTNAQRVAVAAGVRKAGADRFGIYNMSNGVGQGTLHVGYSGPGRPAAVWGAGGRTGGAASRRFTDPSEQAFLKSYNANVPMPTPPANVGTMVAQATPPLPHLRPNAQTAIAATFPDLEPKPIPASLSAYADMPQPRSRPMQLAATGGSGISPSAEGSAQETFNAFSGMPLPRQRPQSAPFALAATGGAGIASPVGGTGQMQFDRRSQIARDQMASPGLTPPASVPTDMKTAADWGRVPTALAPDVMNPPVMSDAVPQGVGADFLRTVLGSSPNDPFAGMKVTLAAAKLQSTDPQAVADYFSTVKAQHPEIISRAAGIGLEQPKLMGGIKALASPEALAALDAGMMPSPRPSPRSQAAPITSTASGNFGFAPPASTALTPEAIRQAYIRRNPPAAPQTSRVASVVGQGATAGSIMPSSAARAAEPSPASSSVPSFYQMASGSANRSPLSSAPIPTVKQSYYATNPLYAAPTGNLAARSQTDNLNLTDAQNAAAQRLTALAMAYGKLPGTATGGAGFGPLLNNLRGGLPGSMSAIPAITVQPARQQMASSTALPMMLSPTNLYNGPSSAAARGGQPYYGGSSGGPQGPTYTGPTPTAQGGANYNYSISPDRRTVSWVNSAGRTLTALRNT